MFSVAFKAALAVGAITPITGTSISSFKWSLYAVAVLQAITIALTPFETKNLAALLTWPLICSGVWGP